MVAKKRDLALLPASACSFAKRNSSSLDFCSEILRTNAVNKISSPNWIGITLSSIGNSSPALLCAGTSTRLCNTAPCAVFR